MGRENDLVIEWSAAADCAIDQRILEGLSDVEAIAAGGIVYCRHEGRYFAITSCSRLASLPVWLAQSCVASYVASSDLGQAKQGYRDDSGDGVETWYAVFPSGLEQYESTSPLLFVASGKPSEAAAFAKYVRSFFDQFPPEVGIEQFRTSTEPVLASRWRKLALVCGLLTEWGERHDKARECQAVVA